MDVLLVEDSPIAQRVINTHLRRLGCHVDIAEHAYKALAMAVRGYDIILLDNDLPSGFNGQELAKILKMNDCFGSIVLAIPLKSSAITDPKYFHAVYDKPLLLTDLSKILAFWRPLIKRKNEWRRGI